MEKLLHRTWADVDLGAVRHNYRLVREHLRKDCLCMAVVKADAYGHGAVQVARALLAEGADWLGVSNLNEAIELRENGIAAPLLILAYTPPSEAARLAQYGITQAVLDTTYAAQLEHEAAAANVTLHVHIKLDTGMSRVGFFCQEESPIEAIARACSFAHLQATGIFTHFAMADEPDGEEFTRQQFGRFMHTVEALRERGITFQLHHCCNSAATVRFPDMQLDMVRAGIILYGISPCGDPDLQAKLRPTMAVRTVVSQQKTVPSGIGVGYGQTAHTTRPTVLSTLPIGYADGLLRVAAIAHRVSVQGTTAPLVGRICMDQCTIDTTDLPSVSTETVVTIFGDSVVPVTDYASACQTIPYESYCLVGKRVPRCYSDDLG